MPSDPIYVGISRCLLGDDVRYDGGHKRHAVILDVIGPHVWWVRVCPEVEVGMGTPREPVELVTREGLVRMVGVTSGRDWTGAMTTWAAVRIEALKTANLSGFILKSRSPSCDPGFGLFARALATAMPELPVASEDALDSAAAAEAFLARVRAYHARGG